MLMSREDFLAGIREIIADDETAAVFKASVPALREHDVTMAEKMEAIVAAIEDAQAYAKSHYSQGSN